MLIVNIYYCCLYFRVRLILNLLHSIRFPGRQLHGGAALQHPAATARAEPTPPGGAQALHPAVIQPAPGRAGGGAAVCRGHGLGRSGGGPQDGAQGHERAAGGGAGQALKIILSAYFF